MTRKILLLLSVVMFTPAFMTVCYAGEFNVDGRNITVTASGTGYTLTAARIDARRNAAQKALGFMMKAASLLRIIKRDENHDEEFSENIMLISRGIIAGNEEEIETHEDKENHIFTVTLRVSVKGDELLRGLTEREPEKYLTDGSSLVADAMRREQMKRESAAALTELLSAFPVGDYVRVSAVEAGNFDIKNETLNLNLKLTFDRRKYFNEAVPSITSLLDYAADARITDIPFMLPSEQSDNDTVTIRPSQDIRTMKEYRALMGIERENRIIKDAGYANIYVQTRNYYFNAYRINHDAFIELVNNLFTSKGSDNNFMAMNGNAEVKVNIISREGMNVLALSELIDISNIMYFMNTDGNALFQNMTDNISDERQCALFILPAFGFDNGDNHSYVLCQNDNLEVPALKVSAENLIGSYTKSSIVFKR